MKLFESKTHKMVKSDTYNYMFRKTDGFFARWGKTEDEDPAFSPFGPEILDLEISSGECIGNCKFCYKANGNGVETVNMNFDQFKLLLSKMPRILTQIAFGITNIHTNPDFFKMMKYARSQGIIPNYTTHGLDVTDAVADLTARLCGAVAVSVVSKEKTYDTIQAFSDAIKRAGDKATLRQINIHYMLSEETYDRAFQIVKDAATDPRLVGKLNAIVFLQYKPKGKNPDAFHVIPSVDKYKKLTDYCKEMKVGFGFDSCSAPLFFKTVEGADDEDRMISLAEPCESFGMFSSYINCLGEYFPCSFCEGEGEWQQGIDVLGCEDFLKDVWFSDKVNYWRNVIDKSSSKCDCKFSKVCRSCPIFDVTACKNSQELVQLEGVMA